MVRAFAYIGAVALFTGVTFGQSTGAPSASQQFEVSDIHTSPPALRPFMNGPFIHGPEYVVRNASMVDLISTAYGVDSDKVLGGPNWLEFDRFDVRAIAPAGSTAETRKQMLQALLADRFKLVMHNDSRPFLGFSLVAGKSLKLKAAEGAGDTGCQVRAQGPPQPPPGETAGATPVRVPLKLVGTCHGTSMAALAEFLRDWVSDPAVVTNGQFSNPPVLDKTGLEGTWDFEITFPLAGMLPLQFHEQNAAISDALDKQLGLKLEDTKVPMPVILVDHVNEKPTDNPPDALKRLPPPPTEFEVAEIKPTVPAPPLPGGRRGGRGPAFQNDRMNLQGYTLRQIINLAWNLTGEDMLVGAPKWLDSDQFDFIAKAPAAVMASPAAPGGRGPVDVDLYRPMIQKLLMDKFKLAVHYEDRPMNALTLTAAKPKLQKADPAGRTRWFDGPLADGKDPRVANPALNRLVQCQNITMAQLAALLPSIAGGYVHNTVVDATGLTGAYDFTLSFSAAGIINGGGGRGGDVGGGGGGGGGGTPGAAAASDPSGGISLYDAISRQLGLKLEMQKRPMPVLVIDHIEQKPADN